MTADAPASAARALDLVLRYGADDTVFQATKEGFRYAFFGEDACVAYVVAGGAWVVAGGPIAPEARRAEVARAFVARARDAGRRVCFFGLDMHVSDDADLARVAIGEEPSWDAGEWGDTLRGGRRLREQLRRAKKKGLSARIVVPREIEEGAPLRVSVEAMIARWLASRPLPTMHFLVDVEPFALAKERLYAVVEANDAPLVFVAASPIPRKNGWFVENILREPFAPNGACELALDCVMREIERRGATYVTLGLAPLAGEVHPILRALRSLGRPLYNFNGVRAFKARLRPRAWERAWLAFPKTERAIVCVYDVLRAFAGESLVRFAVRSIGHRRAAVAGVLGIFLVAWTVFLGRPREARWFPSPVWWLAAIAFDVAMAASLLLLARRWRRMLGTLVALFATADAIVTLAEVGAFGARRAHSASEWLGLAIATLAPVIASACLWYARRDVVYGFRAGRLLRERAVSPAQNPRAVHRPTS